MLAQLILHVLMSQGSKKAVYFFYSADLGGALLIAIVFLIFGSGNDGVLVFIAGASYVLYFFNVGRKKYTEENVETFAINLLKWSAISIPFDLVLAGLPFLALYVGST